MQGEVEAATLTYIIRDHDAEKFAAKKALALAAGEYLNKKYGEGTVTVEIKDSYRNMAEIIRQHYHLIDRPGGDAGYRRHPGDDADPRRHRRRDPLLYGPALPQSLHWRGQLPPERFEYIPVQSMELTYEDAAKGDCRPLCRHPAGGLP